VQVFRSLPVDADLGDDVAFVTGTTEAAWALVRLFFLILVNHIQP